MELNKKGDIFIMDFSAKELDKFFDEKTSKNGKAVISKKVDPSLFVIQQPLADKFKSIMENQVRNMIKSLLAVLNEDIEKSKDELVNYFDYYSPISQLLWDMNEKYLFSQKPEEGILAHLANELVLYYGEKARDVIDEEQKKVAAEKRKEYADRFTDNKETDENSEDENVEDEK
jgi:hypothetical protein